MPKKESAIAKQFDSQLQQVWAERNIERKKELALTICDLFEFKDKKEEIKRAIVSAKTVDRVDMIITNACLSGEGLKVI